MIIKLKNSKEYKIEILAKRLQSINFSAVESKEHPGDILVDGVCEFKQKCFFFKIRLILSNNGWDIGYDFSIQPKSTKKEVRGELGSDILDFLKENINIREINIIEKFEIEIFELDELDTEESTAKAEGMEKVLIVLEKYKKCFDDLYDEFENLSDEAQERMKIHLKKIGMFDPN